MLTRRYTGRTYGVVQPQQNVTDGLVRVGNPSGTPQSWAISRPGNSPSQVGAPQYLTGTPAAAQHNRRAMTGGVTGLSLRRNPAQENVTRRAG